MIQIPGHELSKNKKFTRVPPGDKLLWMPSEYETTNAIVCFFQSHQCQEFTPARVALAIAPSFELTEKHLSILKPKARYQSFSETAWYCQIATAMSRLYQFRRLERIKTGVYIFRHPRSRKKLKPNDQLPTDRYFSLAAIKKSKMREAERLKYIRREEEITEI